MTKDDVIKMAHEAGLCEANGEDDNSIDISHQLERFFHLAYAAGAKAEQDRCCKIVYGMAGSDNVAQRTVDAIRGKE